MGLKILLADSDREWLASTKKSLLDGGYEIEHVENGKEIQLSLYNKEFFALIVNFSIENYPLGQVLKFIKNNVTNNMTIIVVVNDDVDESEVDVSKLKKIRVTEVVYKKDGFTSIQDALEGNLSLGELVQNLKKRDGVSEEVEVSEDDSKFTSVLIGEFVAGKNVLFDVYVRLNSGRYVKILHAGDTFSKERINKYKEKEVKYLFFQTSDRKKYVQYQSYVTRKMVDKSKAPTALKEQLLRNTAEKYVEELFSRGVKPQVVMQGKEICETVYSLVEKEKNLYKLLRDFSLFDPNAFNHSYAVTLFASAIIKQFEWQSKATIETTSLACMFHDIGKMDLPEGLIGKHPEKLNDEERISYEKHPELGAKLIDGNRLISNSVQQIIIQHHECYNGTGFPRGIKGSKILTLANIVKLSDDFVRLVEDKECSSTEALKMILGNSESIRKYNSSIVENFIKVFVDPEKLAATANKSIIPSNSRVVKKR